MSKKFTKVLAAASVALVVLIDLATGQGPPIYTNYMQTQPDFRPPPPGALQPVGYLQPSNYPPGADMEREYKKEMELEKGDLKEEKKFEKELKKEEKYDKEGYETTAAPGVLSSFSNSMSDAWKSISSLGRSKRAAGEENKSAAATGSKDNKGHRSLDGKQDGSAQAPVPVERAMDSYEYLQYKNQGYVYFKVPKYLVCNY